MSLRPIEELAARYAAERDAALAGEVQQRRAAGIVHTPPELARAVVRVGDELLRSRLEVALDDPRVLVVDPACGPGAFLAAVLALAEERTGRVRLLGYDIDDAALAWAARLRDHPSAASLELACADVLESDVIAERVQRHGGPLVVLGNPPWATVRAQPSARDQARLDDFRRGVETERKLGVLSDAYVRFFALCTSLARESEAGALVGLVTNASFLDGPVHRGMRARLLEWFDELCVLDLGGSALLGSRREQRDDNVFGVRPNVAISWLCRYPRQRRGVLRDALGVGGGGGGVGLDGGGGGVDGVGGGGIGGVGGGGVGGGGLGVGNGGLGGLGRGGGGVGGGGVGGGGLGGGGGERASYARSYGTRAEKLAQLKAASLSTLAFVPHACEPPSYGFVPRPPRDAGYSSYLSLEAWLPFHREGVQSNRDAVVVDTSAERLLERLHAFCRGERRPDLTVAYRALHHYDPERARVALSEALERDPANVVQRIAYRPWDERVFCAVAPLCHRPRPLLLAALAHGGIALLSVRKDRGDMPWRHASVATTTVDNCYLSARSSCRTRAFPSFTPDGLPNVGPRARELLAAVGCEHASSVDVQHYLLGVMSAESYQLCWDSELHHDYPRVPAPRDAASFERLRALGALLAALHATPSDSSASQDPPAGTRYRDLPLAEVPLALRIGHVQPLAAYIAQRANQPVDAVGLAAVHARAERLVQLAQLLAELDLAVIESFGRFQRT